MVLTSADATNRVGRAGSYSVSGLETVVAQPRILGQLVPLLLILRLEGLALLESVVVAAVWATISCILLRGRAVLGVGVEVVLHGFLLERWDKFLWSFKIRLISLASFTRNI